MKPILFSTLMVQAILAGRKTQTRRLLNPQPLHIANEHMEYFNKKGEVVICEPATCASKYQVDDILYVREAFYAYGKWVKEGITKTGKTKWRFKDLTVKDFGGSYLYVAGAAPNTINSSKARNEGWYKRNSLFMPKSASRIFLKITGIAIEQACEITEADAISEGALTLKNLDSYMVAFEKAIKAGTKPPLGESPKQRFKRLWDTINGTDTWQHFVYAYSFQVIEKPKT